VPAQAGTYPGLVSDDLSEPHDGQAGEAPSPGGVTDAGADAPGEREAAHRQELLEQAETTLDGDESSFEAAIHHREATEARLLGGMFTGPDRAWKRHVARQEGEIPAEEAEMASRVAQGEEKALDEDRQAVETEQVAIDHLRPGAPITAEAQDVVCRVDDDYGDGSQAAAEESVLAARARNDAKAGDPAAARADAERAQGLLLRESKDLADADTARAALEADMRSAGIDPPVAAK
jgi:hypothetical protein